MIDNELASIIIVNYNQGKYLKRCIDSLSKSNYPYETIIVDNCSQDDSAQLIREKFPNVRLVLNQRNRGYGAGNNLGIKYAKGKYTVFLNPDTIVEDHWLENLIKPLKDSEKVITTPKILIYDGSAINTCGTINHFTGLTFTRGLWENPDSYSNSEFVNGFSGCCFAVKRRDFEELGGFDENFFLYNEDSELSWRAHLKGFNIMYIPSSIIRHNYMLNVPPKKIYYLERNRYIILRKYLSWKELLVLSLSLLMAEILTLGYTVRNGWKGLVYKLKAIKDGLTIKVKRENGDKSKLFNSLNITIPIEQLTFNKFDKNFKIFANEVFKWNFKVVK